MNPNAPTFVPLGNQPQSAQTEEKQPFVFASAQDRLFEKGLPQYLETIQQQQQQQQSSGQRHSLVIIQNNQQKSAKKKVSFAQSGTQVKPPSAQVKQPQSAQTEETSKTKAAPPQND